MKKERILIECHSLLGDLVLMTPMIKALINAKPDCEIDVVLATNVEKDILLMMGNIIHKFYFFQPSEMKKSQIIKLVLKLRKNRYTYGLVSVSENSVLGAIFLKAVGCKYQIGETSGKLIDYNMSVQCSSITHRVERNVNLLMRMGITPQIISKTLITPPAAVLWAKKVLASTENKKTIVICIGTGDFVWVTSTGKKIKYNCKKWGEDNFINLSLELLKQYQVVWVGGKKELEECEKTLIYSKLQKLNFINMLGKTTISESIALLDVSDLVIAGDTGMIHCAAALGKKSICIIGATDPNKIRPYSENSEIVYLDLPCGPCYGTEKAVICSNRRCLKEISVDIIVKRVQKILLYDGEKNDTG